uniref:Putative secreted protein n=1 Tax=Panstrongylus lignarius TaxID=156445 RepID=A0A224XQK6_9HEMI
MAITAIAPGFMAALICPSRVSGLSQRSSTFKQETTSYFLSYHESISATLKPARCNKLLIGLDSSVTVTFVKKADMVFVVVPSPAPKSANSPSSPTTRPVNLEN